MLHLDGVAITKRQVEVLWKNCQPSFQIKIFSNYKSQVKFQFLRVSLDFIFKVFIFFGILYSIVIYQSSSESSIPKMSLYTDSESAQIGITTMFSILVSTDLIGNTIVGLVIILNRDMRYIEYCNLTIIHVCLCLFLA